MFTVSIAWVDIRGPKLGVIHDPVHGELFRAARGLGAQLNGSPISVSNTPVLDQSLLVTGFPYDIRENPDNNLDHYTDLSLRSLGVRRLGSAALDLAYVAAGRFDAYWELRLFPWDMAAGVLLVKEAGGEVSRAEGAGDIFAEPISLLASNGHIHAEMLEALGRGQNLEG
jgi:myo-inositol-1(or 4)-monophosphatase